MRFKLNYYFAFEIQFFFFLYFSFGFLLPSNPVKQNVTKKFKIIFNGVIICIRFGDLYVIFDDEHPYRICNNRDYTGIRKCTEQCRLK